MTTSAPTENSTTPGRHQPGAVHSAQLLRSTNLPVQMVALAVGYASRSYFSRAFKAAYGADPKRAVTLDQGDDQ